MLDKPSDVHFYYPLKPSRLAKLVGWGCLLLILVLLYALQHSVIFLLFVVVGFFCLYRQFSHEIQLLLLTHLDQMLWSLQYAGTKSIQTIEIIKITDYQLYFIITTRQKSEKDLIIWVDQLSRLALKSMKARAKLS